MSDVHHRSASTGRFDHRFQPRHAHPRADRRRGRLPREGEDRHGRRARQAEPASGPQAGTGTARLRTGVAPMLVASSAGIRQYLETVDTVRGATFNVTWNPNSVRLSRDQTLRSLRRVSRDGGTFTFAAGDPALAALKAGQILLVWGIALRKVTAVEPGGATIVVRTDLVSLPEAIPDGHIAWEAPAAFTGQGSPLLGVKRTCLSRCVFVLTQSTQR